MKKLIVVDCVRTTDQDDDEPRRIVTIASDEAEAEQLCRDEFAGVNFMRFDVQDPIEGPFPGPARVLYYDGPRLSSGVIPAGDEAARP
jgi:hypothetical protein